MQQQHRRRWCCRPLPQPRRTTPAAAETMTAAAVGSRSAQPAPASPPPPAPLSRWWPLHQLCPPPRWNLLRFTKIAWPSRGRRQGRPGDWHCLSGPPPPTPLHVLQPASDFHLDLDVPRVQLFYYHPTFRLPSAGPWRPSSPRHRRLRTIHQASVGCSKTPSLPLFIDRPVRRLAGFTPPSPARRTRLL